MDCGRVKAGAASRGSFQAPRERFVHMIHVRRFLAAACAAAVLQSCASPPLPRTPRIPGQRFATPEDTVEYLKEAFSRGENDESAAWYEFQCIARKKKDAEKFGIEEYYL